MISNAAISRILRQIAYLIELEAQDNNKEADKNTVFKIRAYRRTADIIENLSSNVEEVYNKQKLKGLIAIPSMGKAIALKRIEYAEDLKKRTSINVEEFYHEGVGIGPKTVKALHDSLGLNNLTDVERAAMEATARGFDTKLSSYNNTEYHGLIMIQSYIKDQNVSTNQYTLQIYLARGYHLIAFFDCLHDMGDPVGAAFHALKSLKPDGVVMIVKPFANDKMEDNLNPVGRLFYSASSMACVPSSLASNGPALGAQAGEVKIAE